MEVEQEEKPKRVAVVCLDNTLANTQTFESDKASCATFELIDEDHTIGNVLRYALVKK